MATQMQLTVLFGRKSRGHSDFKVKNNHKVENFAT